MIDSGIAPNIINRYIIGISLFFTDSSDIFSASIRGIALSWGIQ